MAILEKEVWVSVVGYNVHYYEELGYVVPKILNRKKEVKLARGTKIYVKINDLPEGSGVKVTRICDECGKHEPNHKYENIIRNRKNRDGKDRCFQCLRKKGGEERVKNVKYERLFEYFIKNNSMEYLLNEFSNKIKKPNEISKGTGTKYIWICSNCKSEYPMRPSERIRGYNCPYCRSVRTNNTNCLKTTHPDIAKLLFNPDDQNKYTRGSRKKVHWKCPRCDHKIKNKQISSVVKQGLSCPRCSDGISYPEKFMFNLLNQLDIEFISQENFNWSRNKRYDFYIPSLNCIIEVHGLQHYKETNRGRSLQEERKNDRLKEHLAKVNKFEHYLTIDCRYSDLEYIKNKVLDSKINGLFDLSNVNWLNCHEYACNSLTKEVCDLWNKGIKNTSEIGTKLKLCNPTVVKYLKRGDKIGWCNYNPKEEMIKQRKRSKGKEKKIVQLSMNRVFIKEWNSAREANQEIGVNYKNISNVLRGKSKSAGGFKWMYKEDYEKYINQLNEVS